MATRARAEALATHMLYQFELGWKPSLSNASLEQEKMRRAADPPASGIAVLAGRSAARQTPLMPIEIDIRDDLRNLEPTFRRFRGESDYAVMVEIMNACNKADGLNYNESVEDVAHVFEHLTHCDPTRDMLFAEIGGDPVAYSRVFWKDEQDGPRLYVSLSFVVPAWRRRGLGAAILRWNETRLRQIAADHPREIEKVHHIWTTDGEAGAIALFESAGYRIVRTFVEMTRPTSELLTPCPIPDGLALRPAEPSDHRAVWDGWEEAYRDHWGHTPRTDEDYRRWKTLRRFQPRL